MSAINKTPYEYPKMTPKLRKFIKTHLGVDPLYAVMKVVQLQKNERRMCQYISWGLNTRQIMNIMRVHSRDTVNHARTSLVCKLKAGRAVGVVRIWLAALMAKEVLAEALKQKELGGNARLEAFFRGLGLVFHSVPQRYGRPSPLSPSSSSETPSPEAV